MAETSHMKQCPGCDRFVEPDEAECPFCEHELACTGRCADHGAHWKSLAGALSTFAGMTAVTVVSCVSAQPVYGAPAPSCPDASSDAAPAYCRNTGDTGVDTADSGVDSGSDAADVDDGGTIPDATGPDAITDIGPTDDAADTSVDSTGKDASNDGGVSDTTSSADGDT